MTNTSWETSSSWYDKIVGAKGHYYHEQVIIPGVLHLLNKTSSRVLDLACGQGVLAGHLPKNSFYLGIDSSKSLIKCAKERHPTRQFLVHDLEKPLEIKQEPFTAATCILALQNITHPASVFSIASKHVQKDSPFILVLNHPCFRIPRQSQWGIDAQKKLQYRRIDRYMSPLKIPLQTHPGKIGSEQTISFHYPLSFYSAELKKAGFLIEVIEEWCSNKKSTGKSAVMENRSRQEFPLFMAIAARKL